MTIAVATATTACIIPPDLEPADDVPDGGPSSPPVILSASPAPDFSFPGPITLHRPEMRTIALEVEDNDKSDGLYVRFYVDYNRPPTSAPTPAWADCQAAAGSTDTIRIINCPAAALCTPIGTEDDTEHVLEALVSDRPFILDSDPQAAGQDPFRAVADPVHAARTLRSWVMSCEPGEQTL
jgi:hypothetical protein